MGKDLAFKSDDFGLIPEPTREKKRAESRKLSSGLHSMDMLALAQTYI